MKPAARLDHLVVAAPSLQAGIDWCEHTLGVTPTSGGPHPLMGTHNRVLRLDHAGPPRSGPPPYLEIIAIDPAVRPLRAPGQKRWFDLDDATLQARLASHGPTLVHWVARVPDAAAGVATLAVLGLERGAVIAASRATPAGLLQWRITVRDDGQRLFDGALPTLIEWGDTHPAEHLPDSGLRLRALRCSHPQAQALQGACSALGLDELSINAGPAALIAELDTPRGPLALCSD